MIQLAWVLLVVGLSPQDAEVVRQERPDGSRIEAEVRRGSDGEAVFDGKYEEFHPDGSRAVAGRYRRGERHGAWKEWYPGNRRKAQGKYKHGLRDGEWKVYDAEGELDPVESGEYEIREVESAEGVLVRRGEVRDGVLHGSWRMWWADGTDQASGRFRSGKPQGPWIFWNCDGSLDPEWITGVYSGGQRTGPVDPATLPEGRGPDPSRLPLPEFAASIDDERRDAGRKLMARFEEELGDAESEAAAELRSWGMEAAPFVLTRLRELDLSDPDQNELGAWIESELLQHLAAGGIFGWSSSVEPEGVEANRWTVARWFSLLTLMADHAGFREIDLRFQVSRDASLLAVVPPLASTSFEQSGPDEELQARYGARFEARTTRRERDPVQVAVNDALRWLAAHQGPDGSWAAAGFHNQCGSIGDGTCDGAGAGINNVGVTGLALLAFLGDGHTIREGEHSGVVARGISWLLSQQDKRGRIGPKRFEFVYNHAIATQALCEALIFTEGDALREGARKAVAVIHQARNPYGAWRYDIPPQGNNDTSVTAWMLLALVTARTAGLEVGPECFDGGLNWIDEVTDPATGRVGYDVMGSLSARIHKVNDHFPPEKGEAMTAAALLAEFLLGREPEQHPSMGKKADLLLRTLPEWDPDGFGCDMYYWYYGAHAMYQIGGRHWEAWWKAGRKAILESQQKAGDAAGSWDTVGPWGWSGGRVYTTAMMAMSLEAPRRLGRVLAD